MSLNEIINNSLIVGLSSLGTYIIGDLLFIHYVDKYVTRKSQQFNSIEEINSVLQKEKEKLNIPHYNISLIMDEKRNTPYLKYLAPETFQIAFTKDHLNLGTLRHELRHAKHKHPLKTGYKKAITYLLIYEPLAVWYSFSALNNKEESSIK
ncbi:MAG: hypothetical protein ACP5N2_03060 [Candidatus Nanoarchaeia archaeon]